MTPPTDEQEAFMRAARATLEQLRSQMRERFNRDLPLEELLFDRWERAKNLGFGDKTSIYHNSYVFGDVRVGTSTWIGPFTLLDGSAGLLEIGSHCSISAGVQIYTHDTVKSAVSGGRLPTERGTVSIGDNCYIGPQTIISRNVTIGHHSVIGAGSFVNRDIPPYTFAVGTPCRPRGKVILEPDGDVRLESDKELA